MEKEKEITYVQCKNCGEWLSIDDTREIGDGYMNPKFICFNCDKPNWDDALDITDLSIKKVYGGGGGELMVIPIMMFIFFIFIILSRL